MEQEQPQACLYVVENMVARDGMPLHTTVLAIPFEELYLDPKLSLPEPRAHGPILVAR